MKTLPIMIDPTASRRGLLPATLAALSFFAGFAPVLADQKPSEWAGVVNAATDKKPIFWLDGNPYMNEGSELGAVRYRHEVWEELEPGFWGEAQGAFGTGDSRGVGVIVDSEYTATGHTESGALALLFRAPSEFRFGPELPPDKHGLFSRGGYQASSPFEIAIVNGSLRMTSLGEGNGPQAISSYASLSNSLWYWLAMSWMPSGDLIEVTWHLFEPASGVLIDEGQFKTKSLGQSDSGLYIAGTQSAHSATDTLLSQVIVWDTPVSKDGWRKLEAHLK